MPTERIRQLVSADNLEFLRRLLDGLIGRAELRLPVLPEIAARVIAFAGSPDTDAAALARLISSDSSPAAHGTRVVVGGWRCRRSADERRDACAIVHLAHRLAEHTAAGGEQLAAEALADDPVTALLGSSRSELQALCAQAGHVRALLEGY